MAERDPVGPSGPTEAFTGGKLFDTVFTRGMALVEETASYLDGPGREIRAVVCAERVVERAVHLVQVETRDRRPCRPSPAPHRGCGFCEIPTTTSIAWLPPPTCSAGHLLPLGEGNYFPVQTGARFCANAIPRRVCCWWGAARWRARCATPQPPCPFATR